MKQVPFEEIYSLVSNPQNLSLNELNKLLSYKNAEYKEVDSKRMIIVLHTNKITMDTKKVIFKVPLTTYIVFLSSLLNRKFFKAV